MDDTDLLRDLVDYVVPVLPPYETSIYLYLLRRSHLGDPPSATARVGKRTIGEGLGKGTRSSRGNYQHISEKLNHLEAMGFISVGDTDRRGTLYTVLLPVEVPVVREQLAAAVIAPIAQDFYADPVLRRQLFDRDGWRCRYCGEPLDSTTVTLDHIMPVSRGGTNDADNLASACMMCNSIKSGRTIEEVAAQILATVQRRRAAQSVEQPGDLRE